MGSERILIVEDEAAIGELLSYNLKKDGYSSVRIAASGEAGLKAVSESVPDVILLDLMLPGIDGLSVCRKLKMNRESAGISIIMLTAKGEESDIIVGLELGADDYITKPFSPKVVIARIRAVLRRRQSATQENEENTEIFAGPVRIDPRTRAVELSGEALELTCSEFDILSLLARRPGWVYTRNQIINAVRGGDYPVTERAMDVQIVGLRRKLGRCANMVETMRGVGYKFNPDAECE